MAEERTYTDSGTGTPIAENEQVKALLALLKENDSPAYAAFAKLIESVTGMEDRLSIAVGELAAMREDLQKMQDRSLKASLQKPCKTLEGNIASMQQKLSELKGKIVEGCRHILADFKERGTDALNGLANFLHLKPALEAVRQGAENHQQASNRAMERIDTFVSEYHETGKHLKNMRLALMGKEPVRQAKTGGEIARYVKAPYRASRACMGAMKKNAEKAMAALEKLEQAAERRPSVLESMREQAAKLEPVKNQPVPSHDKGSR